MSSFLVPVKYFQSNLLVRSQFYPNTFSEVSLYFLSTFWVLSQYFNITLTALSWYFQYMLLFPYFLGISRLLSKYLPRYFVSSGFSVVGNFSVNAVWIGDL